MVKYTETGEEISADAMRLFLNGEVSPKFPFRQVNNLATMYGMDSALIECPVIENGRAFTAPAPSRPRNIPPP